MRWDENIYQDHHFHPQGVSDPHGYCTGEDQNAVCTSRINLPQFDHL